MKKKIAVISFSLIVGGLLYFTNIKKSKAYYYGPLAGYTGSPHDGKTCYYSNCHNSHPLGSPQPWITSNAPVSGYTPDSIYTITAKAVKTGYTSFGFEISPQSASGAELGTLININSSLTQIISTKYIEQTQYSYQGTDSVVWTFQWKAPAAGTGTVTFYGAFNCGKGNSVPTGSYVFPATLVIPENTSAGIGGIETSKTSFSLFPNPSKGQFNITYVSKSAANVEIDVYGLDGKKISTLLNGMVNEGVNTHTLSLPTEIKPGVYFIQLITNGSSDIQKMILER